MILNGGICVLDYIIAYLYHFLKWYIIKKTFTLYHMEGFSLIISLQFVLTVVTKDSFQYKANVTQMLPTSLTVFFKI